MIVGRLFTYLGQRYEPGSDFDIHIVAESRRPSFIRAFGLSERPRRRKKKVVVTGSVIGEEAAEAAVRTVLKDITEEPPQGGVQGEDLDG